MANKITIPIFIPNLSCPYLCSFCNQKIITNTLKIPDEETIKSIIDNYINLNKESRFEIAFFGGSFTNIEINQMINYLKIAYSYIQKNLAENIRISTRPDAISQDILDILKAYKVTNIELGAQSFDDEVLIKSNRGHTVEDIIKASKLIKDNNFKLGIQIITGLPSSNFEKELKSIDYIIKLNADEVRIYPLLILKGTKFEDMYKNGLFKTYSLEETTTILSKMILILHNHKIDILRVGLHPSENLSFDKDIIAGPYHPSIKELAYTKIFSDILKDFPFKYKKDNIIIYCKKGMEGGVSGYKRINRIFLEKYYKKIRIIGVESLSYFDLNVENY